MRERTSSRRKFVAGVGVAVTGVLAGCLDEGHDPGEQAAGQPLTVPVLGDRDAEVVVEVYEDFGCGGCAHFHTEIKPEIETDFLGTDGVRYEFRDFVLPADGRTSWEAANAARAVQDLGGEDAFWEYAGRLYENQGELEGNIYEDLASDLNVDESAVREAAVDQQYDETVSHYTDEGDENGVERTPSVLVNGEAVDWDSVEYEPVQKAIEAQLQ